MTHVLRLAGGADDAGVIARGAHALAAGQLVAFPTETVYGLGADAGNAAAVERLDRVKRRAPDQPYTLLIADRCDVDRHVEALPILAQKLVERFWPGPLTVVVPARDGGTLGLRLPAHDAAREMLRQAQVPVAAPSANPSGQPPATTAKAVLAYFGGQIDLVIDGGAARLGEASAVIEFRDAAWRMLRSGLIDHDTAARAAHATILFICTGNSCRSPMAEVLCKKLLASRLNVPPAQLPSLGYHILSAGTSSVAGMAASQEAMVVMRERGCDLATHTTRPLDADLVVEADLIYVMSQSHRDAVLKLDPAADARTRLIALDNQEIADPIGGDMERFARCADEIEQAIRELVSQL